VRVLQSYDDVMIDDVGSETVGGPTSIPLQERSKSSVVSSIASFLLWSDRIVIYMHKFKMETNKQTAPFTRSSKDYYLSRKKNRLVAMQSMVFFVVLEDKQLLTLGSLLGNGALPLPEQRSKMERVKFG
jgi:hypothetical protein